MYKSLEERRFMVSWSISRDRALNSIFTRPLRPLRIMSLCRLRHPTRTLCQAQVASTAAPAPAPPPTPAADGGGESVVELLSNRYLASLVASQARYLAVGSLALLVRCILSIRL